MTGGSQFRSVENEIHALHDYLTRWLQGSIPQTECLGNLRRRLAEDFEVIHPTGVN